MEEERYTRESWLRAYRRMTESLVSLGFPEELGKVVAHELRSENAMERMTGYLRLRTPESMEELADEILAIRSDFDRYRSKKEAEYYNSKYNELLYYGLGDEEED